MTNILVLFRSVLRRSFLVFLLSFAHIAQAADVPNPYREGVDRVQLSDEEREALKKYALRSKAVLMRAIESAKGKNLTESKRIFEMAIKGVVAESHQDKRRSELLMRMILNQALQLTVGVPTPDGRGIEAEGSLNSPEEADLATTVLEESIELALAYTEDDMKAITDGNLVSLPLIQVAKDRLIAARRWLTGIQSWDQMLEFELTSLEQWFNVVATADNLERARISDLVYEADQVLTKGIPGALTTSQKARYMRGLLRRFEEQLIKIVPVSKDPGAIRAEAARLASLEAARLKRLEDVKAIAKNSLEGMIQACADIMYYGSYEAACVRKNRPTDIVRACGTLAADENRLSCLEVQERSPDQIRACASAMYYGSYEVACVESGASVERINSCARLAADENRLSCMRN